MRVVDANVLLYAVNADTRHHASSRRWLDSALSGADTVGFTWLAVTAFVRSSTKDGLFANPLTPDEAMEQVRRWLDAPGARITEPGAEHVTILQRLLAEVGSGGNLVSDAHVAAVAIEHRAEVVSFDADFGRFPGLRWVRPPDLLA